MWHRHAPEFVIPDKLLARPQHPLARLLLVVVLGSVFLPLLAVLSVVEKRAVRQRRPVGRTQTRRQGEGRQTVPKDEREKPDDWDLLCHLGDAVHVVSGNLLWHHAAHGQLQLQQRHPHPVVLREGRRKEEGGRKERGCG